MNGPADVRTFDSLAVGDMASVERTIRAHDVDAFAELSGDYSPLHVDDSYAKATPFGKRVVHGVFIVSLVSQLVGMRLPGKYALLMQESLEFKKPVFIDDTIVVTGTLMTKSIATRIVEIAVTVTRKSEVIAVGNVHARVLQ